MKDNIYIQEIEKFNDEISVCKLIDKHVKKIWWIGLFLPLFLLFGFSIPFVICKNYWLYSILLVLAIGYAYFIVRCDCVGKKRKRIIQQQYPYAIQGETDLYSRIIPKIQKQKLTELINSRLVLNKDNLLFLIESLKSKKDENKYLYMVTNVTLTIFIPVLITLLVNYFVHLFNTIHMTIIVEYQMIGILIALIICIIYLDIVLFKNWKLTKERKQNRLIRTLENIYLEISNE
jgi:hypothetical protein